MNARVNLRIIPAHEHRVTLNPWDFKEGPITCVFEFYKGELAIYWPTESAHPGSPNNAQLLEAWVGGVNIYSMLDNDQIDRLEELYLGMCE